MTRQPYSRRWSTACWVCGQRFLSARPDAKTCSRECKVRKGQLVKHGLFVRHTYAAELPIDIEGDKVHPGE